MELALVLPLILIMALAIFDFARAFTASITIESAAREAADFGGLYPWHWKDIDSWLTTEGNMQTRACSAASTLNDYEGDQPDTDPDTPVTCTNPKVDVRLLDAAGFEVVPGDPTCYLVERDQVPCRVEVTVEHEFSVVTPMRLQFGDTSLGLPETMKLTRTSIFPVSNFELDPEPSATP